MSRTVQDAITEANPVRLPSALQKADLGRGLRLVQHTHKGAVAASHILTLPEGAKAVAVLAAFATAGTTGGHKLPVVTGTAAPSAGECAITHTGDVIFNSTDAITEAEVTYVAIEGEVREDTLPVASHICALPVGITGRMLLEAEVLAGTDAGVKAVVARGTAQGSLSDNTAALSADGASVAFATADAATSARVKYVVMPGSNGAPAALRDRLEESIDW